MPYGYSSCFVSIYCAHFLTSCCIFLFRCPGNVATSIPDWLTLTRIHYNYKLIVTLDVCVVLANFTRLFSADWFVCLFLCDRVQNCTLLFCLSPYACYTDCICPRSIDGCSFVRSKVKLWRQYGRPHKDSRTHSQAIYSCANKKSVRRRAAAVCFHFLAWLPLFGC